MEWNEKYKIICKCYQTYKIRIVWMSNGHMKRNENKYWSNEMEWEMQNNVQNDEANTMRNDHFEWNEKRVMVIQNMRITNKWNEMKMLWTFDVQ